MAEENKITIIYKTKTSTMFFIYHPIIILALSLRMHYRPPSLFYYQLEGWMNGTLLSK